MSQITDHSLRIAEPASIGTSAGAPGRQRLRSKSAKVSTADAVRARSSQREAEARKAASVWKHPTSTPEPACEQHSSSIARLIASIVGRIRRCETRSGRARRSSAYNDPEPAEAGCRARAIAAASPYPASRSRSTRRTISTSRRA